MARVSHKKIKQLIAQKQSKITDRQFFTSRILANHLRGYCRRTDTAVRLSAQGKVQHHLETQESEPGLYG